MRRDLSEAMPDVQWPSDIDVSVYRAELAPAVHHLMQLGYREGGGRVPLLDEWQQRFERDPEYDPTLCFIACDARVWSAWRSVGPVPTSRIWWCILGLKVEGLAERCC